MSMSNGPTVVDLFAGAGGASLGFAQAGYRLLAAVEVNKSAAATYQHNLSVPVLNRDLGQVDVDELSSSLQLAPGELDVLIGCPPCQGFSVLRREGGELDERNHLVLRYLEILAHLQPKMAVFENVPGLVRSAHGREFYAKLRDGMLLLGYGVADRELCAADYGVPQNRMRLVMLAGRDGRVHPFPWATHAAPESDFVQAGFRKRWRTVRDAIERFPAPFDDADEALAAGWPNHVAPLTGKSVLDFLRMVPPDGGGRSDVPREHWLECHLVHSGHKDVYGRLSWDRPAGTITTGCTNPSKGRFAHPCEHRGLTVREAAALQGFPVDFVFHGADKARQIGNAVPPPLARAVAMALLPTLREPGQPASQLASSTR